LSPTPSYTSTTGTDSNSINYVEVTVTYPFECLVSYPGIASSITLTQTVRMASAPP
jgi:hypothetical protein